MPLSAMPESFVETELAKGNFPRLFNRKENHDVVFQHLPDLHFYVPDGMKLQARQKFLQNKNSPFDFHEELLRYCLSDVEILRK